MLYLHKYSCATFIIAIFIFLIAFFSYKCYVSLAIWRVSVREAVRKISRKMRLASSFSSNLILHPFVSYRMSFPACRNSGTALPESPVDQVGNRWRWVISLPFLSHSTLFPFLASLARRIRVQKKNVRIIQHEENDNDYIAKAMIHKAFWDKINCQSKKNVICSMFWRD